MSSAGEDGSLPWLRPLLTTVSQNTPSISRIRVAAPTSHANFKPPLVPIPPPTPRYDVGHHTTQIGPATFRHRREQGTREGQRLPVPLPPKRKQVAGRGRAAKPAGRRTSFYSVLVHLRGPQNGMRLAPIRGSLGGCSLCFGLVRPRGCMSGQHQASTADPCANHASHVGAHPTYEGAHTARRIHLTS